MKIAFIGLGIMGSRMAANILNGGHNLSVHNRTKIKAEFLLKNGAIWADTPEEVAKEANVIITMLENPDVVEDLALGKNGFLPALKEGSLWIDCSTVNPSFSKRMGKEAEKHGIRFLDAPVSGSKEPAAKAALIFLVGGQADDLAEVQPLLDLMGNKTIHIGDTGKGSVMKIMINQLLGQSMLAFSESLSLGIALGMDKSKAMDILLDSAVTPPILKAFRSRIEDDNYEPNFPLKHLQKDLHLFTDTAYEYEKATPLTNAAKEIYALAKQKKQGNLDFSSIFKYLNE